MKTSYVSLMTRMLVVGSFLVGSLALADNDKKQHDKEWKEKHPRQAEVNGRLRNQDKRVDQGVKSGELTKKEAKKIERQDKAIYREEQNMKTANGGNYITKQQQATLNKQENKVSNEIKKDESANAAPAAPAPSGN